MRRAIGKQVKKAFYKIGLQTLLRKAYPSRYPAILRYHSIGKNNEWISDGITVSGELFEEQICYFSRHYNVIPMIALVECIRNQDSFPENAIVLTFDDGYADNYQAAQLLNKYGSTGVFYVTAGCIETDEKFWVAEVRHLLQRTRRNKVCLRVRDSLFEASLYESNRFDAIRRLSHLIKTVDIRSRERIREELRRQLDDVPALPDDLMLTWQQLREMVAMGMEIGGHTLTHCNLSSALADEAWLEISQCKTVLEQQLGIEVKHFAYPNGGSSQYYNGRIKGLVRRAGFLSACTSKPGLISMLDDLLELRRMRTTERLYEIVWEIEQSRLSCHH